MTAVTDTVGSLVARAAAVAAMTESVPSPCISVCRMDPERVYCEGCLRTLDELRRWSSSSDADKKIIWALVAQRAQTLPTVQP